MENWNKYNVFVQTQFRVGENHSTALAIAHLNELIIYELDNNNSVCAIFLDFAKAFDTCNHKILLLKLDQYGRRGVANDANASIHMYSTRSASSKNVYVQKTSLVKKLINRLKFLVLKFGILYPEI